MESLHRQGVTRVMIVNTHGGNNAALTIAAERAKREIGIPLVAPVFGYTLLANAARDVLGDEAIGHGGGDEASAVLAIRPDSVDMDPLETPQMNEGLRRASTYLRAAGGSLPVRMDRTSPTGATGDAFGGERGAGTRSLALQHRSSARSAKRSWRSTCPRSSLTGMHERTVRICCHRHGHLLGFSESSHKV